MKTINKISLFSLFLFLLSCLAGCGQVDITNSLISDRFTNPIALAAADSNLAEVAIPKIIKELDRDLEQYIPQVRIVTPQPEQTFKKTDISIELELENLPIFRDDKLKLGNHLNLIIDNEPFQSIYSLQEPIVINNLTPGTHSIRVFATRPWGESFKTEAAYAQTTFNVLTETNDNRPKSNFPLLTYNSPTGTIGAEPFLLDFYLTNAPLHAIANNNPNLSDWRVRATVNGTSFILEDWQPIYLKGLKPGENWIQLELIDKAGNNIENAFNNTVRVFNYDPQQQDTLTKLVTNKIDLADAKSIVEQKYYIQPVEAPETIDFEKSDKTKTENIENNNNIIIEQAVDKDETVISEPLPEILTDNQANQATGEENSELTPKIESIDFLQPVVDVSEEQTKLDAATQEQSDESLPSEDTSLVTEVNSNQEFETTVTIPEVEPVEISTSETFMPISPKQSDINSIESESIKPSSAWWKEILESLRQKIEALAKQLSNQV